MMIGHEAAEREWRDAVSGQRLHHAWLLTGRRGLGKMTFALSAAHSLVGSVDPLSPHPDVHILTHEGKDDKEEQKRRDGQSYEKKRNITIAQVRSLQKRLTTRPTLGDYRAVLIDPAEDMERSASNALLKSLEEPPQYTVFFLISHHPAKLLPTIRSRCRVLRFPELDEEEMRSALTAHAQAEPAVLDFAVRVAGGSPGAAMRFLALDLVKAATILEHILHRGDPDLSARAALVTAIGSRPSREVMQGTIDTALALIGEKMATVSKADIAGIDNAYRSLLDLRSELTTYNYDAALLLTEIGTLLARASGHRERVYG